jgi:hypothetical protein
MLTNRLSLSCQRWLLRLSLIGLCVTSLSPSSWAQDSLRLPPEPLDSAAESAPEASASSEEVNPSIALKGVVWRTKPGIVFLRTPIGLLTLSSKTTFKDFRASHEVDFRIHGADLVIDIRKRADGSLVHRYLSGPLKPGDREDKTLRRWTPEGEQMFHYGTHQQAMEARHDGDVMTVEVDEHETIVGLHDVQFDLQIGQLPASGAEAHLLLTGTISKLKSNFIFFRTPIGVVNVNAKIGIKNAKVGQMMTLHVHDRHVVADLFPPQATAPAHRFVTGPLQFATPERTEVKLWTPDGEQMYPANRGAGLLGGTKEGHPITVELDHDGTVVQFHRFN